MTEVPRALLPQIDPNHLQTDCVCSVLPCDALHSFSTRPSVARIRLFLVGFYFLYIFTSHGTLASMSLSALSLALALAARQRRIFRAFASSAHCSCRRPD